MPPSRHSRRGCCTRCLSRRSRYRRLRLRHRRRNLCLYIQTRNRQSPSRRRCQQRLHQSAHFTSYRQKNRHNRIAIKSHVPLGMLARPTFSSPCPCVPLPASKLKVLKGTAPPNPARATGPFPARNVFTGMGTTNSGNSGSCWLDGSLFKGLDSLGFGLAQVLHGRNWGPGEAPAKIDEARDQHR